MFKGWSEFLSDFLLSSEIARYIEKLLLQHIVRI